MPDVGLTPRQREVMDALVGGATTDRAVSQKTGISILTVRTHMAAIRRRTDIHDRAELIRWWREEGSR